MARSLLLSNWAAGGGAIHHAGGALTLNESNLVANGYDDVTEVTVAVNGGAIRHDGGIAMLTDVAIAGNRAENGGGLANLGGTATLTNVTLFSNRASLNGAAVDMQGGIATITNATITDNSGSAISRRGGGLRCWYGRRLRRRRRHASAPFRTVRRGAGSAR